MIKRIQGWLPLRVLAAYGESQASNYASALAFAFMLAMFPLILGLLSLVGLAIGDPATETKAQNLIIQIFPGAAQQELLDALRGVKHSAGWMGLLSLAGLLWSASSIFSTLEFALYGRLAGGFNTYGAQFGLFFLLAAWFYMLSELILLGAVFIQFRLGRPMAKGLVSSPMHESREVRRPIEVIENKKDADQPARAVAPAAPAQPSRGKGFGGYLVTFALLVASVFRRHKRTNTV